VEVRDQILQEATRLFARQGFSGTSIQAISDAVGIRKPSLLYHFPSKDALRVSVLENMLAHWNDVLPRILIAAASDARFDAVMGELIDFFMADPDRARLLVREILDRPEDMRARLQKHVDPWLKVIAQQIDRGREQGVMLEDVDSHLYAVNIINLVVGGIAALDSLAVLVPEVDGPKLDRHVTELMRFARAGLFGAVAS
jgi:AcrR family transcriptional regulator